MNNNLINLLQERPIVVPKILLNNYKKMNITEEELIVIMLIMNYGVQIEYNPDIFVHELNMDKFRAMEIMGNLIDKNILSLEMIKSGRKTEEYISLSLLYEKLFNIIIDCKEEKVNIDNSIFTVFEEELGRLLSPMEIEQIKEWITTYKNEELIKMALKEAVLNGANGLRYIDKILSDWNKKGYKNKEDVLRDKENFRKKKSVKVFDTDWLND